MYFMNKVTELLVNESFPAFYSLVFSKDSVKFPDNIRNLTRISFAKRQEPVITINLPIFHVSFRVPGTISLITQTCHNNGEIIDINS